MTSDIDTMILVIVDLVSGYIYIVDMTTIISDGKKKIVKETKLFL